MEELGCKGQKKLKEWRVDVIAPVFREGTTEALSELLTHTTAGRAIISSSLKAFTPYSENDERVSPKKTHPIFPPKLSNWYFSITWCYPPHNPAPQYKPTLFITK